jgi:hypothetical protein
LGGHVKSSQHPPPFYPDPTLYIAAPASSSRFLMRSPL